MSTYNPFDFANPVSDSGLFAGRTQELQELRYYLDHTKAAPRPIHLAFIGERASGKTSLLNMTEFEAKERGFVTARVDLDQGDVTSQLQFFYKIFGAILFSACEVGTFGGLKAETYDVFLEMVSSLSIPSDRTFTPFLFPFQYARALGASRADAVILDDLFKQDLRLISQECSRPIVITIDECDLLITNQALLQKLRNVFMNLAGYMLVMAGTARLFPALDEVFSPIIRQFKRIPVKAFSERGETRQCVLEPLRKTGYPPEQLLDHDSITDIHDLSGGRPYEIQLICHILFRRVQSRQTAVMRLSLSALEEVREELEKTHELSSRPIIGAVRRLNAEQMRGLRRLTQCNGLATFDQIWSIEYMLNGIEKWTESGLRKVCEDLCSLGVLRTDESNRVEFGGDEFDRLYTKYYGEERKVGIRIENTPPELFVYLNLVRKLRGVALEPVTILASRSTEQNLGATVNAIASKNPNEVFGDEQPLEKEIYWGLVEQRKEQQISAITVRVALTKLQTTCYFIGPGSIARTSAVSIALKAVADRATELGGQFEIVEEEALVPSVEHLAAAVVASPDESFKKMMAFQHWEAAIDSHVSDAREGADATLLHLDLASLYGFRAESVADLNNMGYLCMIAGRYEAARQHLETAVQKCVAGEHSSEYPGLPLYNLGVCQLLLGNIREGVNRVDEAVSSLANLTEADRLLACLLVPRSQDGAGVLVEVREPFIDEVAKEAQAFLGQHSAGIEHFAIERL